MKFIVIVFVGLLVALIGAVSIGYWIERPVILEAPVDLIVAPGDATREIAGKLDSAGLIHSPLAFRWLARWRQIDRHLRPGRYRFEGQLHLSDILNRLHDGNAVKVTVTIPEGWTMARMAQYLANELGFDADSLLKLVKDPALLASWAPGSASLEGYLWPETYNFYWGVAPREVIGELLRNAKVVFADSLTARASELGMTRHQILTLASLIEAEASEGDERGLIAGVFHNRLRDGWLLQCDPTVIYALGGLPPGGALQKSDLSFDSPYNTYLYPGLPPGPICNPGRASIYAALYPESTDAMYFVADGDGSHRFSRTLSQHNSARTQIKREQRRR
jgi:UPF0755 protein